MMYDIIYFRGVALTLFYLFDFYLPVAAGLPQPQSTVNTEEWQWPLSGLHSIIIVKSAQPGKGTPSSFHSIYDHASAKRADTLPYFFSTSIRMYSVV
jgi:hypothetical protein